MTRRERNAPPTPVRIAGILAVALVGCNQDHDTGSAGAEPAALGTVVFPVTCTDQAQTVFNHATSLLHHMTYPQAREEYERVADTDPRCAMAQWGIAMTLFQPTWPTRPGLEDRQSGWDAVQRGLALGPASEREALLLNATAAFFEDPASPDYWPRVRRWEQAMETVYTAFPADPDVASLYALAHLAVARSDTVSRDNADRAAAILTDVYARNAHHPGAMHYLIHANDMPGRERESLQVVERYEAIAPRNPHALHMPTHIYTRLGDWEGVIRGNERAAEAALAHPAGAYISDEYPHALEYLVYAHLQTGADDNALDALNLILESEHLQPTFKTAFHIASTQARYALERRAWDEAAGLVPRTPDRLDWDRFMWPEAIAEFARGLGATHGGDLAAARRSVRRIADLDAATTQAGEGLFARNIAVLGLELRAWIAHTEGDSAAATSLLHEAAALEISTPKHAVTPGPTLPALELLGDLMMDRGEPAGALSAYERSLELYPGRLNSRLGAARAAAAMGDRARAEGYYADLVTTAGSSGTRHVLTEAREFRSQRD